MTKYKIVIKSGCIGCSACVSVCEDNWKLVEKDGHFLAEPKQNIIDENDLECNKEAMEICPVNVIEITNIETGEKIE